MVPKPYLDCRRGTLNEDSPPEIWDTVQADSGRILHLRLPNGILSKE